MQLLLNGLMLSLTYILIGSGLTLVFGILNIMNFAHGEFYMLGAYGIYYLYELAGVNYVLALVLSILFVGFLGLIVERFFYRPIRGQQVPGMIVAMGLLILMEGLASLIFGPDDRGVESPVSGALHVFGASLPIARLAIILIGAVVILILYVIIQRTRFGRGIRAVAEDREAAALQGINVNRICLLVFGIGCALAATAGALLVPVFFINPYGGLTQVLKGFMIIVIGGLGSIPGVIIGGFILGFMDSIGSTYLGGISSVISFAFVVLLLIFRPKGLMGILREEH